MMEINYCQIVPVGHTSDRLILSIDKEIVDKIIFITEKEPLSGTDKAKETLNELIKHYEERIIKVESAEFSFHISNKPIAELTHKILQQKQSGIEEVKVNISGGLIYIDIWFYLACCITNTEIMHGIYKTVGDKQGLKENIKIMTVQLNSITDKQHEFLELFFNDFENKEQFFNPKLSFDENELLAKTKSYESIDEIKIALDEKRGEEYSRGAINGYINKLDNLSLLEISVNPEDRKKKIIGISYLGIAYFLNKLFEI
ncbi:MAG: hypothetical protein EU529_12040 [Promethearchaeota archaeon]|nr:MAG: hypothetical protein EU529_12040 [Candidatus Lokiarchaeota archaeon]